MREFTVNEFLTESESEFIDFKSEYHKNNVRLIHDILCLVNSNSNSDRYIIFGVTDGKKIIGVESDINRKTQAKIVDLIKNSNLNHIPKIELRTFRKDSHEIDILIIHNTTKKPYFLTRQKVEDGVIINAGTVYTRNADRNVSLAGTSTDSEIENMYKERFGLDKNAIQRMHIYLKDFENWTKGHLHNGAECIYYNQFPEFTFASSNLDGDSEQFDESWATIFSDPNASKARHFLMYHATVLKNIYVVACDGGRYLTVLPEPYRRQESKVNSYYYIKDNLSYLTNQLLQHHKLDTATRFTYDSFAVFDSREVAESELDNDYNTTKSKYTHHVFNETTRKFEVIKNKPFL